MSNEAELVEEEENISLTILMLKQKAEVTERSINDPKHDNSLQGIPAKPPDIFESQSKAKAMVYLQPFTHYTCDTPNCHSNLVLLVNITNTAVDNLYNAVIREAALTKNTVPGITEGEGYSTTFGSENSFENDKVSAEMAGPDAEEFDVVVK